MWQQHSSTQIQINQVGARFIDRETNISEVEVGPSREETRTDIIHAHSKGIQLPSSSSEFSFPNRNMEESMARHQIPTIMPQLDGPTSVHVKRKQPVPVVRRTTIPGEGYPDESDSNSYNNRSHEDRRYSGRRRYYQERGGRPLDREKNQGQGYTGRGRPPNDGGPPDDGGPQGGPPRRPRRQGPSGPPGPPGPVHPIIVQQPQVTLDTTALENTFGTVGQSMLQLARAQDQMNRYLQEHLQQG